MTIRSKIFKKITGAMGQVDNQTNEKTGGEKTIFGVLDGRLPPGF